MANIIADPWAGGAARPCANRLIQDMPGPVSAAPRVHVVTECVGAQWAVSPASGAVYVLAGSPAEVGQRRGEALAAYNDFLR